MINTTPSPCWARWTRTSSPIRVAIVARTRREAHRLDPSRR
ncbi:hypothetical protein GMOD_00010092 [Pyrenophora seminiperda CCB06]|uniref:Uncharacterized protein n=1 Tax=Pyrenophora seminiperda CCB06 TaxID=1302712 RepID=A0A3M7LZP2_9PLEO|nr:hypothetical protein GMOD_00010092 [Pyrenophora seminiperda CCB06]